MHQWIPILGWHKVVLHSTKYDGHSFRAEAAITAAAAAAAGLEDSLIETLGQWESPVYMYQLYMYLYMYIHISRQSLSRFSQLLSALIYTYSHTVGSVELVWIIHFLYTSYPFYIIPTLYAVLVINNNIINYFIHGTIIVCYFYH